MGDLSKGYVPRNNWDFSFGGLNSQMSGLPKDKFDMSFGMPSDPYGLQSGDMQSPYQDYINSQQGGAFGQNFEFAGLGNQGGQAGLTGWDKLLGWQGQDGTQHNGWGMPALGAANGLVQSWIGLNQLSLAKKSFSEQKRQFDMNWGAQKNDFNRSLEDRQRQKIGAGASGVEDVASYMAKWGMK